MINYDPPAEAHTYIVNYDVAIPIAYLAIAAHVHQNEQIYI